MRLSRSFLFTLALLALLHVYVGVRLLPDLPIGPLGKTLGALALVASLATMPLSVARGAGASRWRERLAQLGLVMMGLFSSLFVCTLLRDCVLLVARVFTSEPAWPSVVAGSASVATAAAVFATAIGFLNARRRARIVQVDVPLAGLPDSLVGFTIAQISDLHVGPTIRREYVEAIVDAVNGLEAHVVAVTGDLVDGSVTELSQHVAPLARLQASYGAYFVTGNHEYYSGERAWTREVTRLGLRVLRNEHVVLEHAGEHLVLAGVTDFSAEHFSPRERSDPAGALHGAPVHAVVRILLAHQPRSAFAAAAAGFDLQLSGHTHGGQFWPWNLFVRFQQPITAGLHRLQRLLVYTSRGTGYWGPPKRFGAPSEITRLRLVRGAPAIRRRVMWRGAWIEELRS